MSYRTPTNPTPPVGDIHDEYMLLIYAVSFPHPMSTPSVLPDLSTPSVLPYLLFTLRPTVTAAEK